MAIDRFEDIVGWQRARLLVQEIYVITGRGTFATDWGLKDQIRRAAGSIMHNIAEGFDGGSDAEFIRFLRYAQRSATEVQSQLYVAFDQQYLDETTFTKLHTECNEIRSIIGGLIQYLQKGRGSRGSP